MYNLVIQRHLKDTGKGHCSSHQCDMYLQHTQNNVFVTYHLYIKSHTREVYGLYGPDKIRPLHLKPFQQLRHKAHDVELRGTRTQFSEEQGDAAWEVVSRVT